MAEDSPVPAVSEDTKTELPPHSDKAPETEMETETSEKPGKIALEPFVHSAIQLNLSLLILLHFSSTRSFARDHACATHC